MTTAAMVPYGGSDVALPERYERAVAMVEACAHIDDCKGLADKALALVIYSRQAKDDRLRVNAERIHARAIRRCGELLKEFNNQGARTELRTGDSTKLPDTQRQAGAQAGMSVHQVNTAIAVANVPTEVFEAAVERLAPATVTKLAKMGTTSRVQAERAEPAAEDGKLDKSKVGVQARVEKIRTLAAEGWSVPQIAAEIGVSVRGCSGIIEKGGINVPARTMGKTKGHDATRIVESMVMTAENLTADVTLIDFSRLGHARLAEWIAALTAARTSLTQFIHRLEKEKQKDGQAA